MSIFKDILTTLRQGTVVISPVFYTQVTGVPGIATAAAYASGDAFGTMLTFDVPKEGTISNVVFLDYDDEGISKDLILFNGRFTHTADNAAMAISTGDLRKAIGVAFIDTWSDLTANRIGLAVPALSYNAPQGKLFAQLVTRGADNIAVGAIPDIFLMVV